MPHYFSIYTDLVSCGGYCTPKYSSDREQLDELYYWEYNPPLHFHWKILSTEAMYFLVSDRLGISEQISLLGLIVGINPNVFVALFGFYFIFIFFSPKVGSALSH